MINIVIGSNYGDEGKGQTTDFLTKNSDNPIIIKYSGGAQAGHTSSGIVHHQYGSGLVETCLTSEFIFNPYLAKRECTDLDAAGIKPPLLRVSEDCKVTTPFDVLCNQIKETIKGDDRNGSCGMGIWETIRKPKPLFLKDVVKAKDNPELKEELFNECTRNYYQVTSALSALEIDLPEEFHWLRETKTATIWDDWWKEVIPFIENSEFIQIYSNEFKYLRKVCKNRDIIFEGSQGLLLDPILSPDLYKYTTPTMVNSYNPVRTIQELGRKDTVRTWYCTRTYFTRHGNGPFETEGDFSFPDKTNKPNEWQGNLRFGYFDFDLFNKTIENDQYYYSKLKNPKEVGFSITYGDKTNYRFLTFKDEFTDMIVVDRNIILFQNEQTKSGKLTTNYSGSIKVLSENLGFSQANSAK